VRGRRWVWKGLAFAGFAIIALAVLSWVVMLLWNALLPSLFGVRPLHYLQAVGLLVLSRVLLGGLRGHHGPWRHRGWRERWESLTPQERERLREKYARHCRWHGTEQVSDNQQL
jgi:hypothetical protein